MNINITFRLFFKFVDVSDVLIAFDNFTCCSISRRKVTLIIYITNCVVTWFYQFVCLTFEFDFLWTVVYYCIVVFVNWLFIFICHRCFDCLTFSIYIVNINITFRLFFEFVDIGNIFIFFSNWTCNRVWSCKVTIWVNLTNSICTCWYQLISFTVVLNCSWTIIFYCIIVFIDRLLIFICYWIFNSCSFSIFIVNVNVTFFICLLVVVYCITRWFFICWWNWVLDTKSTNSLNWITRCICLQCLTIRKQGILSTSTDNVLCITTCYWIFSSLRFINEHIVSITNMTFCKPTCNICKT